MTNFHTNKITKKRQYDIDTAKTHQLTYLVDKVIFWNTFCNFKFEHK